MHGANRRRLPDLVLAALLGGAAFGLYALTLAPTVLAGDGGEFQFVPYLLGIAHPTGYPLYNLLGWLWAHLLPVGDVAFRLNLFSAFWAALAVGIFYLTTRLMVGHAISSPSRMEPPLSLTLQRLIAVLAAATFAATPTFWSQALIAEVYGLHVFLIVLLLFLLLTWAGQHGDRWLLGAAFVFGLGLAHHRTTLLLAPAIAAFVWLADRGVYRDWRLLVKALALVLVPLALYLYIPLRAPHTPYLRQSLTPQHELVLYENTTASFIDFVLGGPFGGSVDLAVDLGQRLAMAWGLVSAELGWIALALALVGVARLALSRQWAPLTLTGLAYLVSVAFNLVYTIGDIYVLFIPSYLVLVLWLAVGVAALISLAKQRAVVVILFVLLFLALPVRMAITRYADVDQSQNRQAAERWDAILSEPLPQTAVLVSNDRNDIMPLWYRQYVDGRRVDLLGLFPLITPDQPSLGHILDLALSTGRPVYLIKEMPGVEIKVKVEPEGQLWRVLGSATKDEPAYVSAERLADAVTLTGYDRLPHSPHPGEDLAVSLYWEALRPLEANYHSFVHLLDPEDKLVAQSDRQPGGVYYPTTQWRPSERLRDDHLLHVPADAAPGVYRLLAGMYALGKDGMLHALGTPVLLGQVEIGD